MLKQIFTIAALAAMALPASADTLDLTLDDLGSGWGSSYDPATKTITYDSDWTGRGWWLKDGELSDMSKWDQVVVEFEPCAAMLQVVVEYQAEGADSSTAQAQAGESKVVCDLNPDLKSAVMQIYVQSSAAGTVTLTRAYLQNDVVVDENLLWEGEYKIDSWNSGADFAASKVSAGDILEYTFAEPGADSGQVLVKGASWDNLLGAGKITQKDMALGKVQIGVTQQMIDNCGGKIFLQGEGGAVLTKVEKVGSFDADGVLAYGKRVLGNSAYITIPAGTTHLEVKYSERPEWVQICNSGWAEMELPFIESADGATRVYTLDEAAVSAVNDKKEMVINGPDTLSVLSIAVSDGNLAVDAVRQEGAADGKYYNLQGIEVAAPQAPGLYIHNGKKIILK